MDVNIVVDLGDDIGTAVPVLGVGGSDNAYESTPLPSNPPANANKPDPTSGVYEKKERVKTSKVWNDFKFVVIGGIKKIQCNWCKRLFSVSKSSYTSTIGRHLSKCVKYVEFTNNKKQKTLTLELSETYGVGNLSDFSFCEKNVRELASHIVLFYEYIFNFMEHEIFNKFLRVCTHFWKKISRTTVKNNCISTYNVEKMKLKTLLCAVESVSITTDMWTFSQRASYMVVTYHFIDFDWVLQRRILNFYNVPPPHSGVVIVDALRSCFEKWGIVNKVFKIIGDNAKSNDVAIRILRDDFELSGVLPTGVGGRLFHVSCCAHVTNLLMQAGLAEIVDIIDYVRQGIKYIVALVSRLKQFSDIAR
jgi:hypothetical protein